jgi:hypothetical protein
LRARPADHNRHHIPVNKRGTLPARFEPGSVPFKPTQKQREAVETMAGYGIPQAHIALLITDDGIDPKTLRLHFREELDRGAPKALVAKFNFHHG